MSIGDSSQPERRLIGRPFAKGISPNPGGKPRKLVEIEIALDREHRTVKNMLEVFERLRALATEDVVRCFVDKKGESHESVTPPHPAFMKLYLDRCLGPVVEDHGEKIQALARELVAEMVSQARTNRESREIHDPVK